jgi:hypothetical protein
MKCERVDAWLGNGYYFWYEIRDARHWGQTNKLKPTGRYQIYEAEIDCTNILDAVFHEPHYQYWVEIIDFAIEELTKRLPLNAVLTISEVHDFIRTRKLLPEGCTGILFEDLPENDARIPLLPYSSGRKRTFVYRRRIQLAAYTLDIIRSFSLLEESSTVP